MMTMATRIVVCIIFIMVCLIVGCSKQEEASLVAVVLENNQSSLLVEPAEGAIELSSSDRFVVHIGETVITDQRGNKVDITAVAVGDKVKIIYSGQIAESYPAQIWAYRVQIVD